MILSLTWNSCKTQRFWRIHFDTERVVSADEQTDAVATASKHARFWSEKFGEGPKYSKIFRWAQEPKRGHIQESVRLSDCRQTFFSDGRASTTHQWTKYATHVNSFFQCSHDSKRMKHLNRIIALTRLLSLIGALSACKLTDWYLVADCPSPFVLQFKEIIPELSHGLPRTPLGTGGA